MGGKNSLINYESIESLRENGFECIDTVTKSMQKIKENIELLRKENFKGEKGLEFHQSLIDVSGTLYELSKLINKSTIYIDAKLKPRERYDKKDKKTKNTKLTYIALKK